jgi:hypothetical protein
LVGRLPSCDPFLQQVISLFPLQIQYVVYSFCPPLIRSNKPLSLDKDPCHHPKQYLDRYYKDMGRNLELVKEDFWWQLAILLGNAFHEERSSWLNRTAALDDESAWRDLVDEVAFLMSDPDKEDSGSDSDDVDGEYSEDDEGDGNDQGVDGENDNEGKQGGQMEVDQPTQEQGLFTLSPFLPGSQTQKTFADGKQVGLSSADHQTQPPSDIGGSRGISNGQRST